ncbi:MAG: polysaccharide deacetylase family protein [Pseudomonadaceae bacterium]|nr:polysaccharide deacetylase family protein [Pseudomonadaceae bacterium]
MLLRYLFPLCLAFSSLAVFAAKAEEAPTVYNHATVLMYHHISTNTPPSTSTSPSDFIKHLDLLKKDGFQVWPLERVIQHLKRRRPMPDKVAVITFDDGYISVYEEALPILKDRELPFAIFVNADLVNANHPLYMNWAQLKEAQQAGGIIANHTLSHAYLIRKLENENDTDWLERVRHEIEGNQQELIKNLGNVPKIFAYPYGEYTPEIQKLVQQMGYVAFGQQSGAANPYTGLFALPRYAANGTSANPSSLRTKLHALPFPLVNEQPASTVLDGKNRRPTLTLTLSPGDYLIKQFRCYGPDAQLLKLSSKTLADGNLEITINSDKDIHIGRPRYNCTAPHAKENRYFWFTRQWLMPYADGSWYDF